MPVQRRRRRQERRENRRDRRDDKPSKPSPPAHPPTPTPGPPSAATLGSWGNASIDQWDNAFLDAVEAVFRKKGVRVDPRFMKAMMAVESGNDGNYPVGQCRVDGSCGPMQIKQANHQWRCPECDFTTVPGQIELATHIIGDTMKQRGRDEYDALLITYFPTDDVINGTTQQQYADRVRQLINSMGGNPTPATGEKGRFLSCLTAQLGKPYVHATAGPNTFDCSGLVDFCYQQATGREIPGGRGSWLQCDQAGRDLGRTRVAKLEPGDLLCYLDGQHVGIYAGHNTMINALNESEGVRENDITTPYWAGNFDRARRLWES